MKSLTFFFSLVLLTCDCFGIPYGAELKSYNFGTSDILRDHKRDRVYCAVPSSNSTVAIDTKTMQVLATIFTGSQPSALAESPDGAFLYVANAGSNAQGLTVLDLSSFTIVRSIITNQPVQDVAVGNGIVYTLEGDGIRAYNTADGTPRTESLSAYSGGIFIYGGVLDISPDGNTLFYFQTGLSPSSWYRINVTTWPGTVLQSGDSGSNGQSLALSADGKWITFAWGAPYSVNKLLASNPRLVYGTFDTGAYPHAVVYSPDGSTLYTTHTEGRIDVWDTTTYLEGNPIITTGEPDNLMCDRLGKVLFAGTSTTLKAFSIGTVSTSTILAAKIEPAVAISWNSASGYFYQVEFKNSLSDPVWNALGSRVAGNGLKMSTLDPFDASKAKYYRVRQINP